METNNKYWDCECIDNYIHSKNIRWCLRCGANRDEQPDSIQEEVERLYLNSKKGVRHGKSTTRSSR